jgi:hypothetical protein
VNIPETRRILVENNINEAACPINPRVPIEGALCLYTNETGGWRIRLNERGNFVIDETFASEDLACRRFLCLILSDPTYRKDFRQQDLINFRDRIPALLGKYGLECRY